MYIKDKNEMQQILENFKNEQNITPKNIHSYPFKTSDKEIILFDKNQQDAKIEKADTLYTSTHFRNIFLSTGLLLLLGNGLLHLTKSPIFANSIVRNTLSVVLTYSGVILTSFALFYITPMIVLDKRRFKLCYHSPYKNLETPKQIVKK